MFSSYNLSVEAVDITRANISAARTTVTVFVDSTNDSPPQFENVVYELHVSENSLIGTMIGVVHAFDNDFAMVNSSKSHYEFEDDIDFLTLSNVKNYLSYSIFGENTSGIIYFF